MPLVESNVSFTIESQGTVRPRTETVLSAEVSGVIVRVSPKFIAGGVFKKGEELLRIDPTNYRVAVDQAQALLEQRQIEHESEAKLRGQGYRTESNYAAAAAALASAKAGLVRAKRDMQRTIIRLPYAGIIRNKEADLGQYVTPGSRLGVTFATDYAEVRMPLTDQDLAFVDLPDASDISAKGEAEGPVVELSAVQRGKPTTWRAQIVRTEGVVDESNRVTYVVARVKDPYQLNSDNDNVPIPMGTFVRAVITGVSVENVIKVPRSAFRGSDRLMFVDDDNRLQIRSVNVIRTDAESGYVLGGAESGERICLTAIAAPINGMQVRINGQDDDEKVAAETTKSSL